MPSSPPPDRFQREIDDIIKLAERRLEHQSFGYRVKRSTRRLGGFLGNFNVRLPSAEVMGGWGLAMLLISWLLSLPFIRGMFMADVLLQVSLALGIALLAAALITSLMRRNRGSSVSSGGDDKMWRGERVSYGDPYNDGFFNRIRRMFRGR
jgi:hypothetical protein